MRCTNCGADIPLGASFCVGCGARADAGQEPRPSFCPMCGSVLKGGEAFCGSCGARLDAGARQKKSGGLPGWAIVLIAVGGALVIVLAIVLSLFTIRKGQSGNAAANGTAAQAPEDTAVLGDTAAQQEPYPDGIMLEGFEHPFVPLDTVMRNAVTAITAEITDSDGYSYGPCAFTGTFEPVDGVSVPIELYGDGVIQEDTEYDPYHIARLTVGEAVIESAYGCGIEAYTVDIDTSDGVNELMVVSGVNVLGMGNFRAQFYRYDTVSGTVTCVGEIETNPELYYCGMAERPESEYGAITSAGTLHLYTDGCGSLVLGEDILRIFDPMVPLYWYHENNGCIVCDACDISLTDREFTSAGGELYFIEREYSPSFYSDSNNNYDDEINDYVNYDVYEVFSNPTHFSQGLPVRVLCHDRYNEWNYNDWGDYFDDRIRWMYVFIGGKQGYIVSQYDFVG